MEVKAGDHDGNSPSTEPTLEGKIILPGEHGLSGTRSTEGASPQGPSHFRQVGQGRCPTAMVCSSETRKSGGCHTAGTSLFKQGCWPDRLYYSRSQQETEFTSGGSKEVHLRKVLLRAAKG